MQIARLRGQPIDGVVIVNAIFRGPLIVEQEHRTAGGSGLAEPQDELEAAASAFAEGLLHGLGLAQACHCWSYGCLAAALQNGLVDGSEILWR